MTKFPSRLAHGTGAHLIVDESRLLLAFREPVSPEDLAASLEEANLALEADHEDDARRMERVNHTTTRYWVRSARAVTRLSTSGSRCRLH